MGEPEPLEKKRKICANIVIAEDATARKLHLTENDLKLYNEAKLKLEAVYKGIFIFCTKLCYFIWFSNF